MFIVKQSIKRPITVIMFFTALSMLGYISMGELPVQLLPNLTFPQLSVQVAMPGASPEKVEKDLLILAEAEIAKMDNIEKITSIARNDGGSIIIDFKLNANMKFASLKLEQRINALSAQLPPGSRAFVGRDFSTEMFSNFLMSLSIRGEGDVDRLRRIAEEKIKPELEKVDGVVQVLVRGGQMREVHIVVPQAKALNYGIDLVTIMQKINANNTEKQYLGRVYDRNTVSFVTFSEGLTTINDLENIVIDEKITLRLGDIADVSYAKEEKNSLFRINGKSAVGVSLVKDNASNLIKTAGLAEKEIARLNDILEAEGIEIVENFNAAEIMRNTISQVEKLAIVGAFLALLVLLFFLRNIKTVLVVLVSIPLSVLITFNIMYYVGMTINILSLVGIAIAVGMLVDNSIVVLENIFRHYESGKDPYKASLDGTVEVTKAIISSTATTIAVFIPAIFMEDKYLVILKELSLSVIFPLVISLAVAFTVIPMVASQFLKRQSTDSALDDRQKFVKRWHNNRLMEIFTVFLKSRLRSPASTIVILLVVFMLTLLIVIPLLTTFQDAEGEQQIPIFVTPTNAVGLSITDRMAREIERIADSLDIVDEIRTTVNEDNASLTIDLFSMDDRAGKKNAKMTLSQVKDYFEKQAEMISGASISFDQNTAGRGGQSSGGGGGGGGLASLFGSTDEKIIIKGFDQDRMKFLVEEIKDRLEAFTEIRRVNSNFGQGNLEMQIWGDQAALDRNGLTMTRVMAALWSIRAGGDEVTSRLKDEYGEYVIKLKLDRNTVDDKQTVDEVRNMVIPVPGRGLIPIKTVSTFLFDEGPRAIRRVDQQRQICFIIFLNND